MWNPQPWRLLWARPLKKRQITKVALRVPTVMLAWHEQRRRFGRTTSDDLLASG